MSDRGDDTTSSSAGQIQVLGGNLNLTDSEVTFVRYSVSGCQILRAPNQGGYSLRKEDCGSQKFKISDSEGPYCKTLVAASAIRDVIYIGSCFQKL